MNHVPKGRLNSIPQMPLVEFDPVLLKQYNKFLLERHFPTMLLLIVHTADERVQLRHAHVDKRIFFLPLKKPVFREGVVNPHGGPALDQLGCFGFCLEFASVRVNSRFCL